MLEAVALEAPELILHLGDHDRDCADIELEFPDIPIRSVSGNCDQSSAGLDIDEFTQNGKRFLMTHGHLFGVKTSNIGVIDFAMIRGADILLYGHTHIQYNTVIENITVINPGSVGIGNRSYAVININDGIITCDLKRL
jgi:hypothetical protein